MEVKPMYPHPFDYSLHCRRKQGRGRGGEKCKEERGRNSLPLPLLPFPLSLPALPPHSPSHSPPFYTCYAGYLTTDIILLKTAPIWGKLSLSRWKRSRLSPCTHILLATVIILSCRGWIRQGRRWRCRNRRNDLLSRCATGLHGDWRDNCLSQSLLFLSHHWIWNGEVWISAMLHVLSAN